MYITKSDYILWRECPHNVWIKKHRPEAYNTSPLSEFEMHLIESGNQVEELARKRFPEGVLIETRGEASLQQTTELINAGTSTIFQASFSDGTLFAAVDILKFNEDQTINLYEVKASNSKKQGEFENDDNEDGDIVVDFTDEKAVEKYRKQILKDHHLYDLAFQVYLARKVGQTVNKAFLVRLNKNYVRANELDISQLFVIEDITEFVDEVLPIVAEEVEQLITLIGRSEEPSGPCCCIYKGRSKHCTTFKHHNTKILGDSLEYSVHDLTRVGQSKAKLEKLIDEKIFDILDVPDDHDFGPKITKQIEVHKKGFADIDHEAIRTELSSLQFPLYFLDYEAFNPAIPRFRGFRPYQQIPFEFSLHRLDSPDGELIHSEFLYTDSEDPSRLLVEDLQKNIGTSGTVLVWYKPFEESHINKNLAVRLPEYKEFIFGVNGRLFDLMTIFSKHLHVHPDFHGSASIKKVLPVLCPELSYAELEIGNGSEAMNTWNKLVTDIASGNITPTERAKIEQDMRTYCALDTYAMYAIWKHLNDL